MMVYIGSNPIYLYLLFNKNKNNMNIETAEKVSKLLIERELYKWEEEIEQANFCSIHLSKVNKEVIKDFYFNDSSELLDEIIQLVKRFKTNKLQEIDNQIKQIEC